MSYRVAAVLALVLVLAGCVRHRTEAVISDAATVSGSVVIGYGPETIELAKQFSGPSADLVGELKAAVDANTESISTGSASAKPYSADGFAGFETTFADVSLGDFLRLVRHEQTESGVDVRLERSGDTYRFSAELIKKPGQADLPAEAFPGADISLALTFPGPVSDTNGTVAGNTVTWKVQLPDPPRLYATALAAAPQQAATDSLTPAAATNSTSGGGGSSWIFWVIGGVLLVIGLTTLIGFLRRSPR